MKINIFSVPLFYGSDVNGVQFGPQSLIEHGLINNVLKSHEVTSVDSIIIDAVDIDKKYFDDQTMKYVRPIVNGMVSLKDKVYQTLTNQQFPFIVGGDHALALGSLSGVLKHDADTMVIWIDAHTDINTNMTSPSGNVHGMPLASALGLGDHWLTDLFENNLRPENLLYVGVRSIDQGEQEIIKKHNIAAMGVEDFSLEAIHSFIEARPNLKLHLSFDIDSLDKALVPGTSTPVDNGFEVEQVRSILKTIKATNRVTSMDFVEYNPLRDQDNKTLNSALSLLSTFFE